MKYRHVHGIKVTAPFSLTTYHAGDYTPVPCQTITHILTRHTPPHNPARQLPADRFEEAADYKRHCSWVKEYAKKYDFWGEIFIVGAGIHIVLGFTKKPPG